MVNIKQLGQFTKKRVSLAVYHYASMIDPNQPEERARFRELAIAIRQGDLLLCTYQDDARKGGE